MTNPTPRAALSRTGSGVTRPPLPRPVHPESTAEPPAPGGTAPSPPAPDKHQPDKHQPDARKTKKGHKGHHRAPDAETVEVRVLLRKPARRALKDAARERDTSPEELAALVLEAWLER
ncbi:MAG TPA: hypothetical protein VMI11_01150 [Actinomycetes bacterium]|nr:hypothetical protein [Actinomycetes bacterium]